MGIGGRSREGYRLIRQQRGRAAGRKKAYTELVDAPELIAAEKMVLL
jgi:hypothetical protein